jgi:uncharacterized alpha-E superfamily protein
MSNESLVNYRYQYRKPIQDSLVLDLLVFDPNNPRSLRYQVDRLKPYLRDLPKNRGDSSVREYDSLIAEADLLLQKTDKYGLVDSNYPGTVHDKLDEFLDRMISLLSRIPEYISKYYFKHEMSPRSII